MVLLIWVVGLLLAGLAVGALIGRWWALALAVLVPVGFIPAGDDSDASPEWITALILLAPPALIGLAIGVAVRRASARE